MPIIIRAIHLFPKLLPKSEMCIKRLNLISQHFSFRCIVYLGSSQHVQSCVLSTCLFRPLFKNSASYFSSYSKRRFYKYTQYCWFEFLFFSGRLQRYLFCLVKYSWWYQIIFEINLFEFRNNNWYTWNFKILICEILEVWNRTEISLNTWMHTR